MHPFSSHGAKVMILAKKGIKQMKNEIAEMLKSAMFIGIPKVLPHILP